MNFHLHVYVYSCYMCNQWVEWNFTKSHIGVKMCFRNWKKMKQNYHSFIRHCVNYILRKLVNKSLSGMSLYVLTMWTVVRWWRSRLMVNDNYMYDFCCIFMLFYRNNFFLHMNLNRNYFRPLFLSSAFYSDRQDFFF